MIEWEKPCGCKVKTNTEEASIKAAVELKWKQVDVEKPVKKMATKK